MKQKSKQNIHWTQKFGETEREGGRESEEERVIDNWGKGRGRLRKREIGHGWVIGAISLVLGCDETSAI